MSTLYVLESMLGIIKRFWCSGCFIPSPLSLFIISIFQDNLDSLLYFVTLRNLYLVTSRSWVGFVTYYWYSFFYFVYFIIWVLSFLTCHVEWGRCHHNLSFGSCKYQNKKNWPAFFYKWISDFESEWVLWTCQLKYNYKLALAIDKKNDIPIRL